MKGKWAAVLVTVMVAVLLAAGGLFLGGCAGPRTQPETRITAEIDPGEEDAAVWGRYYPRQYASYLKNREMSPTVYGGSVPDSKLDQKPYLRILFAGYGFGEDYNEDRGHIYSVEDTREIKRITPKSVASCWNCKTPTAPKKIAKEGVAFYSRPFSEVDKDVKHPITCWDCHDPKTMQLRVTRQNMINAFQRQGKDVNASSLQEMRTYVCAQCHNEYYFKTDTKEVTNPWDRGFTVQDIEEYFNTANFADWVHPLSGANMIKIQHPEFELFTGSVHQSAGVSCADCHMPYIREGVEKYSSHWWTSPLKTLNESCKACHRQSTEWLRERVLAVQHKTNNLLDIAGEEIVRAIRVIEEAAKAQGANQDKLKEARQLHRKAQIYWDWVAAENSMGFHNGPVAMHTLGLAVNAARDAQISAMDAMGRVFIPPTVKHTGRTEEDAGKVVKQGEAGSIPKQ